MVALSGRARGSIVRVNDVAIFTIAQDEPEMLPVWRRHYEGAGDLYVLDHDSALPVEGGIPLHHKWSWDFTWWHDMVQQFQEALFEAGYTVVVFATPDEILQPVSVPLRDFLKRDYGNVIRPTAYDIVDMSHSPSSPEMYDEPLEWRALSPWVWRRWWVRVPSYDKPLILRAPYAWSWGLHSTREDDPNPSSHVRLYHLHRMDYDNARVRHARKRLRLNHTDITQSGSGGHNLFAEDPAYTEWFYHDQHRRQRTPWSIERDRSKRQKD